MSIVVGWKPEYGTWEEIVVRPALDHYIGRLFEKFIAGSDPTDWGIQLEDGVIFRNKDEDRPFDPDDLKDSDFMGSSLLLVTMSEAATVAHFGVASPNGVNEFGVVAFTPTGYTIADPSYNGEEEVYPQALDPEDAGLPVDPSPDRAVEAAE